MKTEAAIKAMIEHEVEVLKLHSESKAKAWADWKQALKAGEFDRLASFECQRDTSSTCIQICEGRIEVLTEILKG